MSDSSWDAHHEHVKNKGLLAKRLYVVLTKPSGSLDDVKKHLPEHLEYQLELEAKAAISLVKDFYGSVDSPDKRKSFSKRRVFVGGESTNEPDQELVSVGAKTTVQI